MKVIGTARTGHVLIEISEYDIHYLLGYPYGEVPNDVKAKIKSGAEIDVGKIFTRLHELGQYEAHFKNAQRALEQCQNLLGVTRDAVGQLVKNPTQTP